MAHHAFYSMLRTIKKDPHTLEEVGNIAQEFLNNKKTNTQKVDHLWMRIGKDQKVLGDASCIVKQAFCFFDQNTIAQGSSRPYKSSNNLLVDSKPNMNVPRESVYDAEMYRILFNWLTKVYHYVIIGQ
ncbi:hypothetical protein C2G38_2140849 [Gigaspora rosea]|uniref:Uncharacterized protein n=1 Tax=Gigaspora rosea TaxID=44941 RepID=A0A397VI99_9GLOM|nr:hypothetical protein C2G38_2140849 [Gigaspora rosea]